MHARTLHRILLGAALVVKGVAWPHAPTQVALVLVVAGLVALHGRWARAAFAVAAVLIWATFISASYRANHFALMAVLTTLAVGIGRGDDERSSELGQLAVLLTMVQVSTVYVFAAVWKVNPEFLSGAVLHYEWGRSWLAGPTGPASVGPAVALATILGELAIVALLWIRRTVRWGVSLGVVLHAGMILTIGAEPHTTGELVAFALCCASAYPFFLLRAERRPLSSQDGRSTGSELAAPDVGRWTFS